MVRLSGDLHDLADIHDGDRRSADYASHREIVRDEDVAETETSLADPAAGYDCSLIETSSAETGSSQTMKARLDGSARRCRLRWRGSPEKFVAGSACRCVFEADEARRFSNVAPSGRLVGGKPVQGERLGHHLADRQCAG